MPEYAPRTRPGHGDDTQKTAAQDGPQEEPLQTHGNAAAAQQLGAEGSWFDTPQGEQTTQQTSWWQSTLDTAGAWWDAGMDALGLGGDQAPEEEKPTQAPTTQPKPQAAASAQPAPTGEQQRTATPSGQTTTTETPQTQTPQTEAPQQTGGPYTDKYGSGNKDPRLQVDKGQLTFDAEGTEGGRYHTRTAHWPGGASGVTIGRGYDLGQHSKNDIIRDMTGAGVSEADANKFTPAAGKTGRSAQTWLAENKAGLPEITLEQQEALFGTVYDRLAKDVERISGNYARIVSERENGEQKDYEVNWDTLHPALRDIAVDLRYRGDYTPATRKYVQPLLIANDLKGMAECMADRSKWSQVPKDRFERRAAYMQEAVEKGSSKVQLTGSGPVTSDKNTDSGGTEKGSTESGLDTSVAGKTYRITASALNVRSEPDSSKDNKLGRLKRGDQVTATATSKGWLQIRFEGKEGWISADFATEVGKDDEKGTGSESGGDYVLSGANWRKLADQKGWANSNKFEDLDPTFGSNAKTFVEGLRANGASVTITAGLRHKKRAYLMHFAWHVAKGSKSADAANKACRAEGINIEWSHGNATQTRNAAQALVNAFGLVRSASLTSNHMSGEAIDMKISNVPRKLDIGGKSYTAGRKDGGVMDESKVDHIGKELGVIWYGTGDWVHWSKTGR
ncbi:MAG: SH3 domain-containing protein [Alphaproteobacteria bacterium]|nr:SH3 domain-containing protein [Alphaproteobacteria bacterium]